MKKVLFFLLLHFTVITFAQQGALDTTFNPNDLGFGYGEGANRAVACVATQSDGKVLIGGSFSSYNNLPRNKIARLNTDGSLDTAFIVGTGVSNGTYDYVNTLAVQPDGKILIGGYFTSYNGTVRNNITRLNTNGSIDTSFIVGTGTNSDVSSLSVQSDGKILIGGRFTTYNGTARSCIARLNANGSLDTSFVVGTGANEHVRSVVVQTDGKILIGGDFTTYNGTSRNRIARLNTNGSLDTSFIVGSGADDIVICLAVQSDGKILIGGNFTSYNGTTRVRIARLNTNGSIDTSFIVGTGANFDIVTLAIQSDGKILIGGRFTAYNNTTRICIARLNSDGSLDDGFNVGSGANNNVYSLVVQSDGKIFIGGDFTTYNGTTRNYIARLNIDGSLNTAFNLGTGANQLVLSLAVQSDNKILIGGNFTAYNGIAHNRIARLNATGTLDTGFIVGSGANGTVRSLAFQSDGKIIIGGDFSTYNGITQNGIARLNSDGSLDTSFTVGTGVNSGVVSLSVQSDGKIIIGGSFTSYNGTSINRIARLNVDGSIDTGFNIGTGFDSTPFSLALQSDGKILIGGNFTTYNGTAQNRITRLNINGSLDSSFVTGTGASGIIRSVFVQTDGKILIGGGFTSYNGTARNYISRLNSDGSLDISFTVGTGVNSEVSSLSVQWDGKIIIGGFFTSYNGTARNYITRLNSNGSLDSGFSVGSGADSSVQCLAVQADGKILIGGYFNSYNGIGRNRIARIIGDIPPPIAFSQIFCTGRTVTNLLAIGSNLKWYETNSSVSSLSLSTTLVSGTYYVSQTVDAIESVRTAVSITINPLPKVSFDISPSSVVCEGANVIFNGIGASTYAFNGSVVNNTSFVASTSGTYTVTGTDANGCVNTNSRTLTVTPLPTVNAVDGQTVCSGNATSGISFSGSAAQFNWSNTTTSIGLAASGSGAIPSFTASNIMAAPVTATVSVVPKKPSFAYIPNYSSNNISVINTATNAVTATIPVGIHPFGLAMSPDGSKLYVENNGSANVSVINTATNTVTATIGVGSFPSGVAVNSDGSKVYVANYSSSNVSVINTATNTVSATVSVGTNPYGVVVHPNDSKIYVANYLSNSVSVINSTNNTVINTITVGTNPYGICMSPNGGLLYVANNGSNTVSVINTYTDAVVASIPVSSTPSGVSVTPDGNTLYVTQNGSNTVAIINTATNTVTGSVTVGSAPLGISSSSDGGKMYVANGGSNTMSVINTATNTVNATVTVGSAPYALGSFVQPASCSGSSVNFTITVNSPINVTSAIISSNNTNSNYARIGDDITLSFTTSETLANTLSVLINGNAVAVTGSDNSWSASKTVDSNDSNGIVFFSISLQDPNNCSENHTTVTDGPSVTIDTSLPTVTSASISSSNENLSIAMPGDMVSLSFTASESLTITPIVMINGESATVFGSGTNWTATTTVLACSGSVVSFTISISDDAGNTTTTTATSDNSQVVINPITSNGSVTTSICDGETYHWDANNTDYTTAQPGITHVSGCNTATLNLTVNPRVTTTFTQVAAICSGTTLSDLPTTSNNGITGTWSPALNNITTTEYTFTPTEGLCATITTMTIEVNQCSQVFCYGARVSNLTPSGAGIKWYASETATTPLGATALLTTKTYYYTETVGVVVSAITPEVVEINPTSIAGSISGAYGTICYNSGKTLTLSATHRGNVQWQSAPLLAEGVPGTFSNSVGETGNTLNTGNLTATTYFRALVTSGLCSSKNTAPVKVNVRLQSVAGTIAGGGATVCPGTNSTLLTLSGQVGSVQWYSSTNNIDFVSLAPYGKNASWRARNLTETTYYRVEVTKGIGCIPAISTSVVVNVKPVTNAGIVSGTSIIPYNTRATLEVTGYDVGATLLWKHSRIATGVYYNGDQPIITNATYVTAKLLGDVYYRVTVTKDGCSSSTAPFLVDVNTLGKFEEANTSSVQFEVIAYPNPSSSEFTIESSAKGAMSVKVYDMQGRLVEKADTNKVGSKLAAGTYSLIVNQGSNTKSVRVIKK